MANRINPIQSDSAIVAITRPEAGIETKHFTAPCKGRHHEFDRWALSSRRQPHRVPLGRNMSGIPTQTADNNGRFPPKTVCKRFGRERNAEDRELIGTRQSPDWLIVDRL